MNQPDSQCVNTNMHELISQFQDTETPENEMLNNSLIDFQETVVSSFSALSKKFDHERSILTQNTANANQVAQQVSLLQTTIHNYLNNTVTDSTKAKLQQLENQNNKLGDKLDHLEILLLKARVLPVKLAEAYLREDWAEIEKYQGVFSDVELEIQDLEDKM
ncbi:hypothetical protein SS50377_22607 [Spironucleus salmonicida]|uniref:Uncharacterized protein n=1 Tax=Spironucleus salmonicida TaxID=348837 RepID=V6LCD6_9EUKA|nr:hypothetical protein SS50377_22607 [Spironucleus salmonicida]|eukprot:EST41903.1 Hypothetical protein SS50377_18206 [Spironucleus salmonicida]